MAQATLGVEGHDSHRRTAMRQPIVGQRQHQRETQMNIIAFLTLGLISAALCSREIQAAEITFEGNVVGDFTLGTARLGTFNPEFDPFQYKFAYGIDAVGNMDSPNYTRAVSDGNFRPIGGGNFVNGSLSGSGNASGIEGQQLWACPWRRVDDSNRLP